MRRTGLALLAAGALTVSSPADAQLALASAAYARHLPAAAYGAATAGPPSESDRAETLELLGRLTADVPGAPGLAAAVASYRGDEIRRSASERRDRLWYLSGKYAYDQGLLDDAMRAFGSVRTSSPIYAEAQLLMAATSVRQRLALPAMRALDRAAEARPADAHLQDLANLSRARIFYTRAMRLDDTDNMPAAEPVRLAAALKYYEAVAVGGREWQESLLESAWAYYHLGDYPSALGNVVTVESPYLRDAFLPTAAVLEVVIRFGLCDYDGADRAIARLRFRFDPVADDIDDALALLDGRGLAAVRELMGMARDPRSAFVSETRRLLESTWRDRAVESAIAFTEQLEREQVLAASPGAPPGVRDILRRLALAASAEELKVVRARLVTGQDEARQAARMALRLKVDVLAARRALADVATDPQLRAVAPTIGATEGSDGAEVVSWPMAGARARRAHSIHATPITSACTR